jgi:hypothetical protein
MSIEHLYPSYERFGPCVRGCGQTTRYVEVDRNRENYRAECRICGTYSARVSEVEDACDP